MGWARLPPVVDRTLNSPSAAKATVLLDCRWLGLGGAGRVTELLLSDLATLNGTRFVWKLWGDPEKLRRFPFPSAQVIPWAGDPNGRFGQTDLFHVPSNDIAVYLHQIRPLRPGASITFVHDTIPLRYGRWRGLRALRRVFLFAACRLSTKVITVSEPSRDAIVRDLAVPREKLEIVSLSVDSTRVERIRKLRRSSALRNVVLYVGRFAPHKNLRRLCHAYAMTDLRAGGGRLVLAGGTDNDVKEMAKWLDQQAITGVDVRGHCSESELDELLATSRALVQPSLEEGYGLPAVEAAAVGLQVATSRTGFASEIPAPFVAFLDPLDEVSIAHAIDEAVGRPAVDSAWIPTSSLGMDVVRILGDLVG
jgi:glycosyltransferase involved in cell wall biosynthesis